MKIIDKVYGMIPGFWLEKYSSGVGEALIDLSFFNIVFILGIIILLMFGWSKEREELDEKIQNLRR